MKQIHFVKYLLVVLSLAASTMPVLGVVTSGTTYTLTSTNGVPTGWTNSGCSVGSNYTSIANGNYLTTDDICVGSLTTIQINARYYGGSGTTAAIKFEFITSDGKTTYNLGTLTPTTNKETASYSLTSFTQSIAANTKGHFKISAPNATSTKYAGLKAIVFTYTTGTCGSTKTLSKITLSGQTTSFTQNGTWSFGGTVTATYSDGTTANVTSSTTFSGYNMANTGTQTVTASYTEGGVTKTATYQITINAASAVQRTVTWYVNSQVYTTGSPTSQVTDGSKVTTLPTAPSAPSGCSTKVFVGWTTAKISTETNTAPAVLFTTAAEAPTVSGGNVSYYAVFADQN